MINAVSSVYRTCEGAAAIIYRKQSTDYLLMQKRVTRPLKDDTVLHKLSVMYVVQFRGAEVGMLVSITLYLVQNCCALVLV